MLDNNVIFKDQVECKTYIVPKRITALCNILFCIQVRQWNKVCETVAGPFVWGRSSFKVTKTHMRLEVSMPKFPMMFVVVKFSSCTLS